MCQSWLWGHRSREWCSGLRRAQQGSLCVAVAGQGRAGQVALSQCMRAWGREREAGRSRPHRPRSNTRDQTARGACCMRSGGSHAPACNPVGGMTRACPASRVLLLLRRPPPPSRGWRVLCVHVDVEDCGFKCSVVLHCPRTSAAISAQQARVLHSSLCCLCAHVCVCAYVGVCERPLPELVAC